MKASIKFIQNSEFRIQNSEFRIQNSEFGIQNSEFGIQNSELWIIIDIQKLPPIVYRPYFYSVILMYIIALTAQITILD